MQFSFACKHQESFLHGSWYKAHTNHLDKQQYWEKSDNKPYLGLYYLIGFFKFLSVPVTHGSPEWPALPVTEADDHRYKCQVFQTHQALSFHWHKWLFRTQIFSIARTPLLFPCQLKGTSK